MNSNIGAIILILMITALIGNTAQAQVQTEISGFVRDRSAQPIFGATVYLQGSTNGAVTDENGYYTLKGVSPGNYNLVVGHIGFIGQTQYNIIIKSVGNQMYDFVLETDAQTLDEVVLTPDKNVVTRPIETPLSTQTFTAAEIATYPGGNNDVVQVAQSLPGISPSIGGFRNDLIIRGGAPNESVYYLDGVEIPNINHFSTQGSSGGPVGMLNVSFINDVTLSSSAFGAQYDNPLSGVLQFSQISGSPKKFSGNFRLSATEAAFTVNGPLFKGDKELSNTTYMLSVRRSYLQFIFELVGLPIRPAYWDYQFKVDHKINAYNSLSLTGVGSIDDFSLESDQDLEPDGQALLEQAPFIEQQSNAIGVTWTNRFRSGKGYMETTLSNNLLINDFSQFRDNVNKNDLFFSNEAREVESKLRYNFFYFPDAWKINAGFNVQYSDYDNSTRDLINNFTYRTDIGFYKYGFFANASKSFFKQRFKLSFGFRSDGDSFTEGNDFFDTFSPRMALSYEFAKNWKINATAGRYYKLPPYTVLGFRQGSDFVNRDVDYTRSDHLGLGIEYVLGPASSISLEGFFKWYDQYPVSVADSVSLANKGAGFEVLGNEEVESVGRGRSYGLELLYQQKLTKRFYAIFSYTFFYSEFTGFDRDTYLPSTWDSRHLVSFTGGLKFKKGWEISSRWRFAGETPYVPTDLEASAEVYPEIVLDYSRLGELRLGVFSQLDFRVDKKFNFRKVSLDIFLDIQNILAQTQPTPPEYVLSRQPDGQPIQPRQLEEVAAQDGAPIPSIGVVIDF